MSRIHEAFENKKAFIPFITAGDPDLNTTAELLVAVAEAGADLIEVGIPFSDPTAEGPVIQEADERALAAGCTTDKLFAMLSQVRPKLDIPVVFMTYMNPVFTYGKERFLQKCVEVGMDGIIIPDLPYEEKDEMSSLCDTYGVDLISLVAPTSHERIRMIAGEAKGFLYLVSSLGVTGVRKEITTDIDEMVALVREASDIPCAVGFGISMPEQAKKMAGVSDGAIVGSAIVRMIGQYGKDCVGPVRQYVKEMKAAVNEA